MLLIKDVDADYYVPLSQFNNYNISNSLTVVVVRNPKMIQIVVYKVYS